MKIFFLGDIVGKSGRAAVVKNLKNIAQEKKIDFSHFPALPQLGAPGLRKAGLVFIDVWYHMKPREPLPCVGNPLL